MNEVPCSEYIRRDLWKSATEKLFLNRTLVRSYKKIEAWQVQLICPKYMHDCALNHILSAPTAYPEGNGGYPEQQVNPGMAYDPMKQPMGPGVQGERV